jgi:hypothetical protein
MAVKETTLLADTAPLVLEAQESAQKGLNPSVKELIDSVAKVDFKAKAQPFGDIALNTQEVDGDQRWMASCIVDLANSLGVQTPHIGYAYQVMGITTSLSSIMGALATYRAYSQFAHAKELGDFEGMTEGALGLLGGVSRCAAGTAYVAARPLAVAAMAVAATPTSLLGRVSCGVTMLGNALFGLFYAAFAGKATWNLYKCVRFYIEYYRAEDKAEFLIKQLTYIRPEEEAKLKRYTDEDLIAEAKKSLQKSCKELKLGKEGWNRVFESINQQDDHALIEIGRAFKIRKLFLSKEAALRRVTSGAVVKEVKQLIAATSKEEPLDKLKAETLKKVQSAWNTKVFLNILMLTAGAFGALTTITMFLFTGPIGAIVTAALILGLVVFPMTAADCYCFYTDLNETQPGKHDKKFLAVSTAICLLAMATSFALTFFFSAGLLPVLFTLITGGTWLILNAISYANIKVAENRIKGKPVELPPPNELLEQMKKQHALVYPISEK